MKRVLLMVCLAIVSGPLAAGEPVCLRDQLLKRFPTREAYLESLGVAPLASVDLVVAWDVHRVATTVFANRVYNALIYQARRPESQFYTLHGAVGAGGWASDRHLIPVPFLALLVNGTALEVVDRTSPDRVLGTVTPSGRVEMLVPLDVEEQGSTIVYDPFTDQLLQRTPAPLVLPHPFPGDHSPVSGLKVQDADGNTIADARLEVATGNPIARNIGYLRDSTGLARAVMRMGAPERALWDDLRTKPGWPVTAFTVAFPRAIYRLDPRHLRIEDGTLRRPTSPLVAD